MSLEVFFVLFFRRKNSNLLFEAIQIFRIYDVKVGHRELLRRDSKVKLPVRYPIVVRHYINSIAYSQRSTT